MKLRDPKLYLKLFKGNKIFAAFPDKDPGSAPPWHWHQEYDEDLAEKFRERQQAGWGIFFTVNELDRSLDPERKRTKKMFKRARAIWIEDDEKYTSPRTAFPIPPNIILNSSTGRYHYYWLTSTENSEEWEQVQLRMVEDYGSDPNAKDLTRVLRLPGYDHNKRNPYQVTYEILHNRVYDWEDIKKAFPPFIEEVKVREPSVNVNSFDEQQAVEDIITGKNFHGSFTSLAMKYANYTDNRKLILMALQGIALKASGRIPSDRTDRFNAECDDLERTIDTALSVTSDESDVDLKSPMPKEIVGDISWPPGLMGELSRSVYEYSPYPYKLVSIITALGLTAGICGRKYNVRGSGLNLYLTLIMPTGSGKDVIQKYIVNFLNTYPSLATGQTFLGAKRVTSPKAMIDQLKENRSMVSIYTETGLMYKSSSGDQQGILRTMLDLYSASGKGNYSVKEAYSSKENCLPSLDSPALTIINESTPAVFTEELMRRGAHESGELARMSIFRYEVKKPYVNINSGSIKVSKDLEKRVVNMMADCMAIQNTDKYDVVNIDYNHKVFEDFAKACTDEENNHMYEDSLKKAMVSRAAMKCIRIAGVLAALEGVSYITDEQWNWAVQLYHYEMSLLSGLFDGGIDSNVDDVVHSVVMPTIVRMLNDEYGTKKKQLPKMMRDKGVFTFSALNQCVRNNRVLKSLALQNKTGLQRSIEYMLYIGLLEKVNANKYLKRISTNSFAYKVTNEFKRLWEDIS